MYRADILNFRLSKIRNSEHPTSVVGRLAVCLSHAMRKALAWQIHPNPTEQVPHLTTYNEYSGKKSLEFVNFFYPYAYRAK